MPASALRTAEAQERMTFLSCTERPARGRLTPTLWREKLTSATYSIVPPGPPPLAVLPDCAACPDCTQLAAWLMASARAFSTGARRSQASGAVRFEPLSWQASTRGSVRTTPDGAPASTVEAAAMMPASPSEAAAEGDAALGSSAWLSVLRGRRHMYRPAATSTRPSSSAAPSCRRPGRSSPARSRPLAREAIRGGLGSDGG